MNRKVPKLLTNLNDQLSFINLEIDNESTRCEKAIEIILKTIDSLRMIIYKSKLQLDLLEKNILGKKIELTEEYQKNMQTATEKFDTFASKINDEKIEVSEKLDDFKKEVVKSYKHLKKAFKTL